MNSRVRTWSYRALTAIIVCALVGSVVSSRLASDPFHRLPPRFRIFEPRLSGGPVVFSDVQSCSCWDGPRDQAQRKYKFHVANHSRSLINVGGGVESIIRLIVAYPTSRGNPNLTVPVAQRSDSRVRAASPPDQQLRVATRWKRLAPSRIDGATETFSVPPSYTVWAIPPNPDDLAEAQSDGAFDGIYTYPTVIDKEQLLPEEAYTRNRLGHQTWTFYVPLDKDFAHQLGGVENAVLSRSFYEPHVIFVGIAALREDSKRRIRILGFAPAPSDNAFGDPSSL